jgi:hypothetical protein
MGSNQDDCEHCFMPAHFLELLDREHQWFEILVLASLSFGAKPAYQCG